MMAGLLSWPLLAMIFLTPMDFESGKIWMMLPLTLIIAVVYKATKIEDMRQLAVGAFLLWITIVGALLGVGAAIYVILWVFV